MAAEQCRLCLRVHSNLVDVFDKKEDNLCEKISMFYGIQIERDEPLTKKICRRCYYLTNSTYEHRVAFQENQLLLKTEPKIEVETELTQNDFLNNLKLTNSTHKSIKNLKRKYPNINIPECCNDLDLEPFVDVLKSPNKQTWGDSSRRRLRRTNSSASSSSSNITNELICSKCQRSFKIPRYLKKHKCVPQHRQTKPQHQCPHCPKNFESKLFFDHHLLSHQKSPEKEVFKSPRAPPQSTQINSINTDLKVLLDYNEVINESILARDKTSAELLLSAVHKPEQQEAPPIETTKSNPSDLLVEGEEVNAFVCLTCNKVFDTLDLLNNHKKYAHKSSLRCDKCTKKFTVVETLMKHQETHKTAEEEQKKLADAEERRTKEEQKKNEEAENLEMTRSKIVARKRTGGALFISKNSESSSDSTSTSSSSDDDCVITDEFTKKPEPLETALEPQSNNPPIEFISTSFEEKIYSNGDDSDVLIIDSDSEAGDDANKQDADKQNSDKQSSDKQKEKEDLLTVQLDTESTSSSSSSTANTYTRPTSQEGTCIMLENEVSYLNYLYNKCNYEETTADQGTQYWKLELLHKFARQAVLPIEINRVIEPHVTVKFTSTHSKVKPTIPQIPWNYNKAIDLNGGSHTKTYKAKQCNQQLSKNQKASIKVPIPVKAKLINGPKNNQYTTKYVPNEVNTTKPKKQIYIVNPNQLEGQTNIQEALQAQNIPNTNQSRSILKNVLTPTPTTTTSPQPMVYTYVPTTPIIQNQNFVATTTTSSSSTPATEVQPFVLNGLQFQSVTNKNPTFVFQQIGQPNFINITPPTFFTTSDNNPSIYLNQQTNIMQPSEIIEPTSTTTDQEQDQEKDHEKDQEKEQTNNVNDAVQRPMIRIKSLSELTAKTPESLKDDSRSYLNVYANYVNARL